MMLSGLRFVPILKRYSCRLLFAACFCLVSATIAEAARIVENVTLNGGTSVSVLPSASISADVRVRTTYTGSWVSDNWRSTRWTINSSPVSSGCVNHANHNSAGTYNEVWNIPAPDTAGVYSVRFVAYSNDFCSQNPSSAYDMIDAIRVGTPISADLVAHWRLDGDGNEYINGLGSTPVGSVSYASAKVCSGFNGDGSGILTLPDNPLLDLPDEFTATAWINPSALNVSGHDSLYSIFSKDTNFEVHLQSNGSIYWWWGSGSLTTAPGIVNVGNWFHVALVHSRSGGYQRLYVNGVLRASGNSAASMPVNDDLFLIGGDIDTGGGERVDRRFYGLVDEVQIYDGPLTASQINLLMNETRSCVSPLAEYRFEGCDWTTGTVVVDELGQYPGVVVQGAHTAPGSDYAGGLCNVANLQNDGTDFDRHISLSGNPIPLDSDWTLMMWINFPPGFNRHFLYSNFRYSVIAGGDHDLAWIREHTSTGARYWGASSSPTAHLAEFPSALTGWHHLAFVGSGTDTILYVDGAYYNSVDYKQNGNYTHIGTTADSVNTNARQNLDTQLDELKFYDGALPAADIAAIYTMEKAGFRWDGSPLNCQHCGAVDHLRIQHLGSGLTCQPSDITLRSCSDAACSSEDTNPVTVTMTSAPSGASTWIGGATRTFTGNQVVQLHHTQSGTVTLGLTNPNPLPTNGYKCFDSGVEGDCDIVFHDSGFVINVPDQVADVTQNVTIAAVRKDLTTEQCVPGFQNITKDIQFWSAYLNPLSGTLPVQVNGTAIAGSSPGTTQTLSFDHAGEATFSLQYADVGQMSLNARYVGTGDDSGLVMTGVDSFTSRPDHFVLSLPGNPAAVDANGAVFKKAGETFQVEVEARNASGSVTPNYGNEIPAESVQLVTSLIAPAGQNNPALVGSFDPFGTDCNANSAAGVACGDFSWNEVGIISMLPGVADADYLGAGNVTGNNSGNVGRFVPARLSVAANTPLLGHGCVSGGFTYLGQEFSFLVDPQLTITALSGSGTVLNNYGSAFWKYSGALSGRSYANASAVSASVSLTSPGSTSLTGENNYDGTGIVMLAGDRLTFAKPGTPLAPFIASVNLDLTSADLTDSDGVCYDPDADGGCDSYSLTSIGATEQRYGRLNLQNAYGPETQDLTIPLSVEYFNGNSFVTNVIDACTSYDVLHLTLSNFQDHLASGETTASGGGTLSAGLGSLNLSAPGGGNDGSVDLLYDLDAAGLGWLKEAGLNPTARATFGIFRGNPRLIYMRESVQ